MKAWMLDAPGQPMALREVAQPEPRRGALLVRMEAAPLLSYMRQYLQGMPYAYPPGPFTPGTNGIGRVVAVGDGVYGGYRVGQRVAVSPCWVAGDAVREPEQALIGLTAISPGSARMIEDFPHGTLREVVEFPASTVFSLDGLDHFPSLQLATLGKLVVPFGGLRRGRLAAGETVVINGAAGAFGSAAVLGALALGAARVVAVGRRAPALEKIVGRAGSRVVSVVLGGDGERDAAAIREAAGGGADLVFDMVGDARDPGSTLACLRSLRRNGRLVLMGSMACDLPLSYRDMVLNGWEVIGNFMYGAADYRALIALVGAGQLPLAAMDIEPYSFSQLEAAVDAASVAEGLRCVVVETEG